MTTAAHKRAGLILVYLVAGAAIVRADVWLDLGTSENEGKAQTVQTVLNGRAPWLGVQAFKKAPPATRVALVQKAVVWVKAFTQSPAFKAAYDMARSHEVPDAPKAAGSYAEQLKKQREDFEKSAADMRKNTAGQPKEVRNMIEKTIAATKAQLDAMANNPERMKAMENATAQSQVGEQARYTQELQKFNQEHPAAVQAAIARRLHQFVDVCGSVDFGAKLVPAGGTMRFANPQYESKSSEWKMCFRAGREPVDAAKALALVWLKEIGG